MSISTNEGGARVEDLSILRRKDCDRCLHFNLEKNLGSNFYLLAVGGTLARHIATDTNSNRHNMCLHV
jgi:hypothetical protein